MTSLSETLDEVENLWGYSKRLRFVRSSIKESFVDKRPSELRVLDVGCGNGSQLALPLVCDGFQLTGIDPHEESIAKARQLVNNAANAHFIAGEIEALVDDKKFDVVILSEVLEHMDEPNKLLCASVAFMKPDGIMLVTVPNGYGEFELDWWIFRGLRLPQLRDALISRPKETGASTENFESGHVQFFTRGRLNKLFDTCNLTVVREASGSFLGGPFVAYSLARSSRFLEWNARITERLPLSWASSWYFVLRHNNAVASHSRLSL